MVKQNYETVPEEPVENDLKKMTFPGFSKFNIDTADIIFNIMLKLETEDLQKLVNKVAKLETLYTQIIAKKPVLSTEAGKNFTELDPEKQRQILLAATFLYGIAYTQHRREAFNALRTARWVTSKSAEEFIYYDD